MSWSTHLPLEHPPALSPSSAMPTSHPGFKSSVQNLPRSSFRLPLNSQHVIEQTLNSHQRVCLCRACFCHCAESLQKVSTAVHRMSQHPAHNSLYKNDCWMKEQLSSSVHACCHWLRGKRERLYSVNKKCWLWLWDVGVTLSPEHSEYAHSCVNCVYACAHMHCACTIC